MPRVLPGAAGVVNIAHAAPLLAQAGDVCRAPVLQQEAASAAALVQLILQRSAVLILNASGLPQVVNRVVQPTQ